MNSYHLGRMSQEEIQAIIKKAQLYLQEDKKERRRISMLNDLEGMAYQLRNLAISKRKDGKIDEKMEETCKNKCQEVVEWLRNSEVV